MTRHAEAAFTEHERGGSWRLRLLVAATDRGSGRTIPRGATLTTIKQERGEYGGTGWYTWKTLGAHPGGNRYHGAATLADAQTRALAWAARRFALAEEQRP